ncbi:Hypothetical_protein [Hexamita inflata]|uniref:Hypothetical_protein n=1 Tax=Hexamita inflata TaxID=28002 RepID=A0AA86N7A8_9EUKA|nr:Hypothetical protein HINF_LOCUS1718 [Hexamita inflata]
MSDPEKIAVSISRSFVVWLTNFVLLKKLNIFGQFNYLKYGFNHFASIICYTMLLIALYKSDPIKSLTIHSIYDTLVQTLKKQETTQTLQHVTPLLNQKLLSTKRSPKQTLLARKSQRRFYDV